MGECRETNEQTSRRTKKKVKGVEKTRKKRLYNQFKPRIKTGLDVFILPVDVTNYSVVQQQILGDMHGFAIPAALSFY